MVRLSRGERKRLARERVEREEREESLRRKQKYRYYFVYEEYWEYEQDFEYEYTEYRHGSYRSSYEETNSSNRNRQKPSSTKRKKDYYKILDVTKNATMVQIKTAYKQKALLYHPGKYIVVRDFKEKHC
jgi:hypothetical protein